MKQGIVQSLPTTIVVPAIVLGITAVAIAVVWGAGQILMPVIGGEAAEVTAGIGAATVVSAFAGTWAGPLMDLIAG